MKAEGSICFDSNDIEKFRGRGKDLALWAVLNCLADEEGFVRTSFSRLSGRLGVPIGEIKKYLKFIVSLGKTEVESNDDDLVIKLTDFKKVQNDGVMEC